MKRRDPLIEKAEILVAFTGGGENPLGNVWKITAKNTDFYIGAAGGADVVHLSIHGPNERSSTHRFHVKLDEAARKEVPRNTARILSSGYVVANGLARRGQPFDGQEVAPRVWRVARIRWTWDMQRPRYRLAAAHDGWPRLDVDQRGLVMRDGLKVNEAADVDIFVSFDEPFWPAGDGSLASNARLGPLRNGSGMFLTATVHHRSQVDAPTPYGLILGRPLDGEEPRRYLGFGPGAGESQGIYWMVENITSRELLDHNVRAGDITEGIIARNE